MTGAEPSAPVWRYPVRYEDVSRDGRVLDIAADPATRAAIAAEADIEALHRLAATLRLRRWRRDGLAVEGRYEAAMTRICVVSLDPFEVEVSGDFERRYLPVDPDRAVLCGALFASKPGASSSSGSQVEVSAGFIVFMVSPGSAGGKVGQLSGC